jgi:hypothetical protein
MLQRLRNSTLDGSAFTHLPAEEVNDFIARQDEIRLMRRRGEVASSAPPGRRRGKVKRASQEISPSWP